MNKAVKNKIKKDFEDILKRNNSYAGMMADLSNLLDRFIYVTSLAGGLNTEKTIELKKAMDKVSINHIEELCQNQFERRIKNDK